MRPCNLNAFIPKFNFIPKDFKSFDFYNFRFKSVC